MTLPIAHLKSPVHHPQPARGGQGLVRELAAMHTHARQRAREVREGLNRGALRTRTIKHASLAVSGIHQRVQDRVQRRVQSLQKQLRPGDVINTAPRRLEGLISKIYKPVSEVVQGTRFGHSAIYVGGGKVIEARIGEGVTEKSLADVAAQHKIIAMRVAASAKERMDAVNYAKKNLGKDFSVRGLVIGGLSPDIVAGIGKRSREKLDAMFCSQLVAGAYHRIPFHRRRNPGFTRPSDILRSEHVKVVGKIT